MDQVKILFLAADPSDSARLRLNQELREIREKLQLSKYRERFIIDSRESVRTGDITQAIFDVEPQIVHFSGHGKDTGDLCFEDVLGRTNPVKPDALANLFELVKDKISCVILNACFSEIQAKAIAKHIPHVIGMNEAIGDKAAIAFSAGFYKALGAGRSVKEAYKFACVEIQLADIPEHSTPVLLDKDELEKGTNLNIADLPESDTSFFSQRFLSSFPGVRGIQVFESPQEGITRLSNLLKEPLVFRDESRKRTPIWWFRGYRNLQVQSFEQLENNIVAINDQELRIKRVVAINPGNYYQCFVYIDVDPMEPCGLYDWESCEIQEWVDKFGYCSEEFAVYKRKFLVTRAEYDDGAAIIDGKLTELDSKFAKLRVRYLTPYNLVLAASNSPINTQSFDKYFEGVMNNLIRHEHDSMYFEELARIVLKLPKAFM